MVPQIVRSKSARCYLPLAALLLLLGLAGCGNRQPAGGQVLFEDGTPLSEGMVVCEMEDGGKTIMARGAILSDGTFRLGTDNPGDGARPGKYRVQVLPRSRTEAERSTTPPIIDPRFEKFETSGLEFEVQERKANQLNITVARPKGRYPVAGVVVYDDGTPLAGGTVVCEMRDSSKTVTARGDIDEKGRFQLGTEKPGDGAQPGKYRVRVTPPRPKEPDQAPAAAVMDPRFEKFETSGLELEVRAAENEATLSIARPGKPPAEAPPEGKEKVVPQGKEKG